VVVVLTGSGKTGPVGDPVSARAVGSADGWDSDVTWEPDAHPASATATTEPSNKRRINTDTSRFASVTHRRPATVPVRDSSGGRNPLPRAETHVASDCGCLIEPARDAVSNTDFGVQVRAFTWNDSVVPPHPRVVPTASTAKLLLILGLFTASGACASGTHRSALSGAPELCGPPHTQTVVSSNLASGTAYVHGPPSNVGVVVGSSIAGETLTGLRIDVVADPLTTAAVPNPSTSAGLEAAQSDAEAQIDVSLGTEKGVVVRKVFAEPTAREQLLVPFAGVASAGTVLAAGHYVAWEVDTYTCSLDTGSPEVKGSRSILADITIS
jgi:hypothetical protein